MKIKQIDHIVLTVKNIDKTVEFYTSILGMQKEIFGENRIALKFGNQKINLHQSDTIATPKAKEPTAGSMDLCFIVEDDIQNVYTELKNKNIKILEGIVDRTGANGEIRSIYINDIDGNLIELSVQ